MATWRLTYILRSTIRPNNEEEVMTQRVMTILLFIPLILVGGWLDEVEWRRYHTPLPRPRGRHHH